MARIVKRVDGKYVKQRNPDDKVVVKRVVRRVVRKSKEPEKVVEPKPEETPVPETPTPTPSVTPGGGRRPRRKVTIDTVNEDFDELYKFIEAEIDRQRSLKDQNGGRQVPGSNIKFLRSALKRTRKLHNDIPKIAKKQRAPRKGAQQSGFTKQVPISDEMADFLGVEHGTRMSRVECTKGLHTYILEHKLQKPGNGRIILPDDKLAKVLHYNKKSKENGGDGPLYYYVMQKLIQQHFLKEPPKEN